MMESGGGIVGLPNNRLGSIPGWVLLMENGGRECGVDKPQVGVDMDG